MFTAVIILTLLGVVLGGLLGLAAKFLKVEESPLEADINELLPGSQCGQCGYPGCGPAAAAVANGEAPVTMCPPGGRLLAETLAEKLGVLVDLSDLEEQVPMVAYVHEEFCIGCTKCFKRCPTDAIIGANKQIHGVFEDACTGCNQCAELCPTEGIVMRPVTPTLQTWYWPEPAKATL